MPLPEWIAIDANQLRINSRFEVEQIAGEYADENDLNAAIVKFAEALAPTLLVQCRHAAGALGFPNSDAKLAIAKPDATPEERGYEIDDQKTAFQQALGELIIAALYKVQAGEDNAAVANAHSGTSDKPRIGSAAGIIYQLAKTLELNSWLYHTNNGGFL